MPAFMPQQHAAPTPAPNPTLLVGRPQGWITICVALPDNLAPYITIVRDAIERGESWTQALANHVQMVVDFEDSAQQQATQMQTQPPVQHQAAQQYQQPAQQAQPPAQNNWGGQPQQNHQPQQNGQRMRYWLKAGFDDIPGGTMSEKDFVKSKGAIWVSSAKAWKFDGVLPNELFPFIDPKFPPTPL